MAEVAEVFGEEFELSPFKERDYAFTRFSDHLVNEGMNDMQQRAAAMQMLRSCVAESERARFQTVCDRVMPNLVEDILPALAVIVNRQAERPTGLPSDSSGGQPSTPESAEVASYRQVIEREEASGRPDRALMVLMAQESTTP